MKAVIPNQNNPNNELKDAKTLGWLIYDHIFDVKNIGENSVIVYSI